MENKPRQTIPINSHPKTIDEAVDRLISELSLEAKARIAGMDAEDIYYLHTILGPHIRNNYGLWQGNGDLLKSCGNLIGQKECHVETASTLIIETALEQLRRSNSIRGVE